MKNSNCTIGYRTRDSLVCRILPRPTAPPRATLSHKRHDFRKRNLPPLTYRPYHTSFWYVPEVRRLVGWVALGTQRPFSIASTSKLGFGLVVRNYVSVLSFGNFVSVCVTVGLLESLALLLTFDASFGNTQHCQSIGIRYVGSLLHMIRFALYCHLVCEGDTHLWQLCIFTISTDVMFSLECPVKRYGNAALFMQPGTQILRWAPRRTICKYKRALVEVEEKAEREGGQNIKCVFWISPQHLSETFLILRRIERHMIKHVYWFSWTVPVILVWF
jgi:hypothetical protein